jgi:hypothetical protein
MFVNRARFCAGVGFFFSGTFALGAALNRSPLTCVGFDPK